MSVKARIWIGLVEVRIIVVEGGEMVQFSCSHHVDQSSPTGGQSDGQHGLLSGQSVFLQPIHSVSV